MQHQSFLAPVIFRKSQAALFWLSIHSPIGYLLFSSSTIAIRFGELLPQISFLLVLALPLL